MTLTNWYKWLSDTKKHIRFRFIIGEMVLFSIMLSCESEQHELHQFNEEIETIGEYIKINKEQYSIFSRFLVEGDLLITLGGYNPEDDGYTLFLPTDEAMERFVSQNKDYGSLEEMLQDTNFTKPFTRYHTVSKRLHTNEFPDGALINETLTGDRLVTGFYAQGDDQLIKVNNVASIIESNKQMTNGYIHVISEVLHPVEISGYDWLQQQENYSILAETMEYCRIRNRLWFKKYTILAEPDSVYHRYGIMNLEDLKERFSSGSNSGSINSLYQFAGYHILAGDLYLNDLNWGRNGYRTLSDESIIIQTGVEMQFNPGVEIYRTEISANGDTTEIDYIRPIWEGSNIVTRTGPIHSMSDLLYFNPFPGKN